MDSGKYHLIDEQGTATRISPNGTFKPKFRANYSGFVNHKDRYRDSPNDPSVLHFAPEPEPRTSYNNPVPDKFSGYAQFPYQLKKELPVYLKKPGEIPKFTRRKTQSLSLKKQAESSPEVRSKQ